MILWPLLSLFTLALASTLALSPEIQQIHDRYNSGSNRLNSQDYPGAEQDFLFMVDRVGTIASIGTIFFAHSNSSNTCDRSCFT